MSLKWNEMIGNVYGDMRVLRRATKEETPWKSHSTPIWVKCELCGMEWVARKDWVEQIHQCPYCHKVGGRGHKDTEMIGKRYGLLTILGYDEEKNVGITDTGHKYVKCQCECGNIISVQKKHLTQGRMHPDGHISYTISCGCARRSLGEINTEHAIEELGYKFNREVIIPECHKWSPFDIEVIHPITQERICFFECDGLQHFKAGNRMTKTEEDLIKQQATDAIKNKYCQENHIPLFRIPEPEYPKINGDYLKFRFPEFGKLLESLESRQKGIDELK